MWWNNMEFVTHGNFGMIRDAWLFVSNFYAAASTQGLITAIFGMALVFSLIGGPLQGILGRGKMDLMAVGKVFIVGGFLYSTLLAQNAMITIYDDVSNKTQAIGNIPMGLSVTAGIFNSIATKLETGIETYMAPPIALRDEGYGLGMKMLAESGDGMLQAALATQIPEQVTRSARAYAGECVAIEAAHNAGIAETIQNTNDQVAAWASANNPALFVDTNLDGSGNPTNTTENVSCQTAWTRLNIYFGQAGPWQGVVDGFCQLMYFDGADPSSMQRCRDTYGSAINQWVLGGATSETFAKNIFLGNVWNSYLTSLDSTLAMQRATSYARISSQMAGGALTSAEWIPTFKSVMLALVILLTALIALFLITGVGVEAYKYILGFYAWWAFLCVIDAVMTCSWMSRNDELFQLIRNTSMVGTDGIERLWPLASKSLNMLGDMRTKGIFLASGIVMGLFKWGGSAIAHMGSAIARSLGSGADEGSRYLSPGAEGQVNTMRTSATNAEQYHRAMADTMTRMDLDYGAGAASVGKAWGGAAEDSFLDRTGRSGITDKAAAYGELGAGRLAQGLAQTAAMGGTDGMALAGTGQGKQSLAGALPAGETPFNDLLGKARVDMAQNLAKAQGTQAVLDKVKDENGFTTDLQAARHLADPQIAKQYGVSEGLYAEYAAMRQTGVVGQDTSMLDYVKAREAVNATMGGANAFAFAETAGDKGLSVAEASRAKGLLGYGQTLTSIQEAQTLMGQGDLAGAAKALGTAQGTMQAIKGAGAEEVISTLGPGALKFSEVQKGIQGASQSFVSAAVGNYLETGTMPQQVRDILDKINATPEGHQMIQQQLAGISLGSLSGEQADRLQGMGANVAPGDRVNMALGYQDGQFSLASSDANSAVTRTDGYSSREMQSETWDTDRGIRVQGDLLGTGKEGDYTVFGQGSMVGRGLEFENAVIMDNKTGQMIDTPFKLDMAVDPSVTNPAAAYAAAMKGDAPLPIQQSSATMLQDKMEISGGSSASRGAITQSLYQIAGSGDSAGLGQVLFGASEINGDRYAAQVVDDLGGLMSQQHGVDLQSLFRADGQMAATWSTKDQIVGWVASKLTGASVRGQASVSAAIQKAAKDSTGVNVLKSAATNIWRADDLSPVQKAEAVTGLIEGVKEEALSTTRSIDSASPNYDRSPTRVMTGVIPGMETGSTPGGVMSAVGENFKQVMGTMPEYTPEDYRANVQGTLSRSGFQLPAEPPVTAAPAVSGSAVAVHEPAEPLRAAHMETSAPASDRQAATLGSSSPGGSGWRSGTAPAEASAIEPGAVHAAPAHAPTVEPRDSEPLRTAAITEPASPKPFVGVDYGAATREQTVSSAGHGATAPAEPPVTAAPAVSGSAVTVHEPAEPLRAAHMETSAPASDRQAATLGSSSPGGSGWRSGTAPAEASAVELGAVHAAPAHAPTVEPRASEPLRTAAITEPAPPKPFVGVDYGAATREQMVSSAGPGATSPAPAEPLATAAPAGSGATVAGHKPAEPLRAASAETSAPAGDHQAAAPGSSSPGSSARGTGTAPIEGTAVESGAAPAAPAPSFVAEHAASEPLRTAAITEPAEPKPSVGVDYGTAGVQQPAPAGHESMAPASGGVFSGAGPKSTPTAGMQELKKMASEGKGSGSSAPPKSTADRMGDLN